MFIFDKHSEGRKDSGFALLKTDLAPPRVQLYRRRGTLEATDASDYYYQ